MANAKNCSTCAYVRKEGNRLWCPFHDEPVSAKLICNDFLDEYQSPQWKSLAAGMAEGGKPNSVPQFTVKDKAALAIMACILIICVIVMCM